MAKERSWERGLLLVFFVVFFFIIKLNKKIKSNKPQKNKLRMHNKRKNNNIT